MDVYATLEGDDTVPRNLNPEAADRALQLAWLVWVGLVLLTLGVLAVTLVIVFNSSAVSGSSERAARWGWATAAYLIVAVPAAFFWRGRRFRGYWHHRSVRPRTYILGMSGVWMALTIGALLGAAACLATRTLLPNAPLAGVAVVTLMVLWPKGTAMVRPVGNPGDVGRYEEPR